MQVVQAFHNHFAALCPPFRDAWSVKLRYVSVSLQTTCTAVFVLFLKCLLHFRFLIHFCVLESLHADLIVSRHMLQRTWVMFSSFLVWGRVDDWNGIKTAITGLERYCELGILPYIIQIMVTYYNKRCIFVRVAWDTYLFMTANMACK